MKLTAVRFKQTLLRSYDRRSLFKKVVVSHFINGKLFILRVSEKESKVTITHRVLKQLKNIGNTFLHWAI